MKLNANEYKANKHNLRKKLQDLYSVHWKYVYRQYVKHCYVHNSFSSCNYQLTKIRKEIIIVYIQWLDAPLEWTSYISIFKVLMG